MHGARTRAHAKAILFQAADAHPRWAVSTHAPAGGSGERKRREEKEGPPRKLERPQGSDPGQPGHKARGSAPKATSPSTPNPRAAALNEGAKTGQERGSSLV